ncbi:DNA helicase [Tanacetum coccineum]
MHEIFYPTCRAACEALGLLGDDNEWDITMQEACVAATSSQLIFVFAHILTHCEIANGGEEVQARRAELIFVYCHGGTGKTFLWKSIISTLRCEGKIVLVVASSVIASLLLPSGQTAHSRFKLPIELTKESLCNVTKNSQLGKLLADTNLIIWDEAPMNDRRCFKALDRSLRDILTMPHRLFGGKSILLCGDFRQTLPVKKGASKMEIVAASLLLHGYWILGWKTGEPDQEDPENTNWIDIPLTYCLFIVSPFLLEIRNFSQNVCESLTEAWLRLKNMLRKCHGHGLTKGAIIQIFYHGLDEPTQRILDITAGGIFLYKSLNQAFQFLEDKVLFERYWPIKSKNEHYRKSVAFADGSDSNTDNS